MKRYIRSGQYIPDLTERFPEGLDGPDMYEPRDPEEAFWDMVDRTENYRQDNQGSSQGGFAQNVRFYWVSYWLQDGRQSGATIAVPSDERNDYRYI